MRRPLYIPDAVQVDIANQVRRAVADTLIEFESAEEDEDAFTGHLGARLTTRRREVFADDQELPGAWTWSLQYRMFRGRGSGATEKRLGADGIFELGLHRKGFTETKSLLFQSKMGTAGGKDLVEQCAKLSTWREAALVLAYEPQQIRAITIDEALRTKGALQKAESTGLEDYIARLFIACHVGDNDLRYHATDRRLTWRTVSGELVGTKFSVAHRFRVRVQPPGQPRTDLAVDRMIPQDDIHKYRMDARTDEMLAVKPGETAPSAKAAIRALSKIYHPDLYSNFSSETRERMKVRMQ
ncbi:MAG TPA: hypothetical protein VF688_11445 [Allosphingosinicella sp.]